MNVSISKRRKSRKPSENIPREIKQALRCRYKLYGIVNSAAAEEPVARGQLLSLANIACTTTLVARIFMSCRLIRFTMWQINTSAADPLGDSTTLNNPSVSWASDYGPLVKYICPQIGVQPGYCDSRPPKTSLASFWNESGTSETDVLFYYNASAGCIVLIEVDAYLNDSSVAPVTGAAVGRVVGSMYYSLGSKITFLNMNN